MWATLWLSHDKPSADMSHHLIGSDRRRPNSNLADVGVVNNKPVCKDTVVMKGMCASAPAPHGANLVLQASDENPLKSGIATSRTTSIKKSSKMALGPFF